MRTASSSSTKRTVAEPERSRDVSCAFGGGIPWSADVPALLLLRLKSRESAGSRFILLNRKIDELNREIRERRRAEDERDQLLASERAARTEAERASQMKDEFLALDGHCYRACDRRLVRLAIL